MANGKTHFICGVITIPIVAVVASPLLAINIPLYSCIMGGSIVGLFITPDKDLEQAIYPDYILSVMLTTFLQKGKFKRRMQNVIVKGIEGLWALYSIPFSHRHMLSHFPVIGSIIRLIYLYCIIGIFIFGFAGIPFLYLFAKEFLTIYWVEVAFFILGLGTQDFTHALLDKFNFHW